MEFKDNFKQIKNFISLSEKVEIVDFVDSISTLKKEISNIHISEISNHLNGSSYMFDISKSEVSKTISSYQSSGDLCPIDIPPIILLILKRIKNIVGLPFDNVFLQILDMKNGGLIKAHYDSTIDGYINYKCNVSVLSERYHINIDGGDISIDELDMYSFESSLYKHYIDKGFNDRRILLSFGILIKYKYLNRSELDPRVRLSKRIGKYFQ